MRRLRPMLVGLVLTTLVAAACGDSSDTTTIRDETTAGTQAGPRPIAGDADRDDREATRPGRDEERPPATEAPAATSAPATTAAPDLGLADSTEFEYYGENRLTDPARDELSTFAVDVDTGSYTLMRAWVNAGIFPDPDSVRVEEYVNYFDGGYEPPRDGTFTVYADGGPTPFWDRRNDIVRIGIKAREVPERRRQDLNLTFVVDVSGSMGDQGKLRMVQDAMRVLVDELDGLDTVTIVSYNTSARVELEPTAADKRDEIHDAIDDLHDGGRTNAEAGLLLGYDMADRSYDRDAVNRVVLLSDGVANVGNTGPEAILDRIGDGVRRGIDLVTIGVGISTYNDVLLEQLADQGDGWYAYVDTFDEAERLFRERLTTSLETVARDVKVQVEFDPDRVLEYRLIGFENRNIADDDFRDDEVDAGEINAGHSVTALYEVALTRDAYRSDDAFAAVRVRWEDAGSGRIDEIEGEITPDVLAGRFSRTDPHFQLAATVAAYAEVLRESRAVRGLSLEDVLDEALFLPLRELNDPDADEFVDLVEQAVRLEA